MVFSWFLHLIHCSVSYDKEGLAFKLRLFGIPLNLNREAKAKKKKDKKRSQKDAPLHKGDSEETKEAEEIVRTQVADETASETELSVAESETDTSTSAIQGRKSKKRRHFHIKESFLKIKQKLSGWKQQFRDIKSIITDETNKSAAAVLFRELKYLLRHYSPRKASGELQFGMEDPALTGQVLGIVSIFPFWCRYKVSVVPDFLTESFYAKGNLNIKGHIRSLYLIKTGIRLIRNKDIRKLINQVRK